MYSNDIMCPNCSNRMYFDMNSKSYKCRRCKKELWLTDVKPKKTIKLKRRFEIDPDIFRELTEKAESLAGYLRSISERDFFDELRENEDFKDSIVTALSGSIFPCEHYVIDAEIEIVIPEEKNTFDTLEPALTKIVKSSR